MNSQNPTLKRMKLIVNKFQSILSYSLTNCFVNIESLGYLNWRKVYKLLKLSFSNSGKKIDKKQLKIVAKFLEFYNDDLSDKKNVKFLYKMISLNNIFDLVLNIPKEVFEHCVVILVYLFFDSQLSKPIIQKIYIELCKFLI